jgi:hypothetical protein
MTLTRFDLVTMNIIMEISQIHFFIKIYNKFVMKLFVFYNINSYFNIRISCLIKQANNEISTAIKIKTKEEIII